MDYLSAFIENQVDIDTKDKTIITNLFTKKHYQKGTEFHSFDEISDTFFYLASGSARSYTITEVGKEITLSVHHHSSDEKLYFFMGDYISYLDQSRSPIICETLSDCVIYVANYTDLSKLYETSFKWMKVGKYISDYLLVQVSKLARETRNLNASQKYAYIKNISPIYEEVLTDYQLASMLGITPQSFSRIKNKQ